MDPVVPGRNRPVPDRRDPTVLLRLTKYNISVLLVFQF